MDGPANLGLLLLQLCSEEIVADTFPSSLLPPFHSHLKDSLLGSSLSQAPHNTIFMLSS